jgi:glycosyltransferase involved in cell wall biosynthesis
MKVLIIDYPWNKTWLPLYAKAINKLGHEVGVWDGKSQVEIKDIPDAVLCAWADRDFTEMFPDSRHILMMRRFEFFHASWMTHKWNKISALICCNPWIANQMKMALPGKPKEILYIPNPIDSSLWTYKERRHGKKIGMVGRIHSVKNYSLAAQILMALPESYELHIAGERNDTWIEIYLRELKLKNLFLHGPIPNKELDKWWEDKNYCLSTATSEGDPMFVLEAMSKGIKPIIHSWPGAKEMYQESLVFSTIEEAALKIGTEEYNSQSYRDFVKEKRSIDLADEVAKIVCNGFLADSRPQLSYYSPGEGPYTALPNLFQAVM